MGQWWKVSIKKIVQKYTIVSIYFLNKIIIKELLNKNFSFKRI